MAIWSNLAGTVTGFIRLGLTGVRLKNSAGELAVRNAGDTADAKAQIADGTAANHAVSKGQLDTKQPLDATLTAIADESLGAFSHRNKIINGKMEIAQRGTGFTDPNDVYTLDRWKINIDNLTGAAWSVSQNTAAQDAINYGNLLRYSVTTVGSMTFADIRQPIEDVRTLQGKQVTVSFLLRYGAVGKTITARLEQNFGSGGSAQVVTTVFTATGSTNAGFTRYSGTVTLPSVAGKTIGAGNNLALALRLTAPNAGDYVDVTYVQLEEGSVATPFEQRPIGTELALCQRYYYKQIMLGGNASFGNGNMYTATGYRGVMKLPVSMRAAPTMTTDTVTNFYVQTNGLNYGSSALSLIDSTLTEIWVNVTTTSAATAGHGATLVNAAGTPWIALSAEL